MCDHKRSEFQPSECKRSESQLPVTMEAKIQKMSEQELRKELILLHSRGNVYPIVENGFVTVQAESTLRGRLFEYFFVRKHMEQQYDEVQQSWHEHLSNGDVSKWYLKNFRALSAIKFTAKVLLENFRVFLLKQTTELGRNSFYNNHVNYEESTLEDLFELLKLGEISLYKNIIQSMKFQSFKEFIPVEMPNKKRKLSRELSTNGL